MIIRLFDQAGAPASVGRQFIDNLGAAVMAEHMRGSCRPWGAADTADMFVEMYARILGGRQADIDRVRRTVIDYAVARAAPARGGGLSALFRRRRSAAAAADARSEPRQRVAQRPACRHGRGRALAARSARRVSGWP